MYVCLYDSSSLLSVKSMTFAGGGGGGVDSVERVGPGRIGEMRGVENDVADISSDNMGESPPTGGVATSALATNDGGMVEAISDGGGDGVRSSRSSASVSGALGSARIGESDVYLSSAECHDPSASTRTASKS